MSIKSLIAIIMALGFLPAIAIAGPDFEEGEWEITTTMKMEGMPFAPPPVTFRQCMTRDERVPQREDPSQSCEMLEQDVSGDTVSWTMRCDGSESTGEVTYSGDSLEGSMHMTTQNGGGEMAMTSHMQGHRIGPCP